MGAAVCTPTKPSKFCFWRLFKIIKFIGSKIQYLEYVANELEFVI